PHRRYDRTVRSRPTSCFGNHVCRYFIVLMSRGSSARGALSSVLSIHLLSVLAKQWDFHYSVQVESVQVEVTNTFIPGAHLMRRERWNAWIWFVSGVAVILFGFVRVSGQTPEFSVEYTVKVASTVDHLFHVTADFKNIDQPSLDLSLP